MVNSCAIITTEANALMSKIHDRMPVILGKEILSTWLDGNAEQGALLGMLGPYPDALMESYPVSSKVNSPRNNGPNCVERVALGDINI